MKPSKKPSPASPTASGAAPAQPPAPGVPAPRPGELRIAVGKKPYAEVIGHAVVEPDVEVCGVLVGKLEEDAHGPWVNVIAAIRGESAREEGAAVTFTHETWNHIHGELDRRYPDLQIVGWYHTHGGFGVFLSDMDRFVHENFFPEKHHVAYVYDPLAGSEAFFHRTEKGLEPVRRFWVGGRERAPATQAAPQPAAPAAAPADAGAAAPLDRAARALEAAAEQRSSLGAMLPWAIALGALALLLVEARGGGLLGGEGSARRGGGGAVALIEWDPATGRAIGIPLEVLEPVEGNVFRDAGGALRPGVQLRAADGSLLVQPGLLARLVRPPPTPAELAAERARAEAAASERAALHRLLAWIGGGVALLAAALGAGFWFLRR